MKHLNYFSEYITESESENWPEDWQELPQWKFLTMLGFENVTQPGDKKKIQIIHRDYTGGTLNITKAGYIRRPGSRGFVFGFSSNTPLSEMLEHVIRRYLKKAIPGVPKEDLVDFFKENPGLIEVLYEMPKLQSEIAASAGIGNTKSDLYKSYGLSPAHVKWLNTCTGSIFGRKDSWEFNTETGLINVKGHFMSDSKNKLGLRGLKFGVIEGSFAIRNAGLESLEGAPKEVQGNFDCSYNELTSLDGAPQIVGGTFNCCFNKLESLIGSPKKIGGSFDCSYNYVLKSLVGCPEEIGNNFGCAYNGIRSLEGAPKKIGGFFNCRGNQLRSPKCDILIKNGGFDCGDNPPLVTLKGFPKSALYIDFKYERVYNPNDPKSWIKTLNGRLERMKSDKEWLKDPTNEHCFRLIFSVLTEPALDEYFKNNPLDIDLLDDLPEIKAGVLKRTGIKDMSALARSMRRGMI